MYVRPNVLNGPEYVLLSSFGPSPNPIQFTVPHTCRALAVAVWDNRADPPHFGPGVIFNVRYKPLNSAGFELGARKIITNPGASDYAQYNVTADLNQYNQGAFDFWDPDAILLSNGLWGFPTGAVLEVPTKSTIALDGTQSQTGTQELFEWVPSTLDGGGGGISLPQPCPPMLRPPWPYHRETLAVDGGPAKVRELNSRVVGLGGKSFDFR